VQQRDFAGYRATTFNVHDTSDWLLDAIVATARGIDGVVIGVLSTAKSRRILSFGVIAEDPLAAKTK
jgi:hypothetical protein